MRGLALDGGLLQLRLKPLLKKYLSTSISHFSLGVLRKESSKSVCRHQTLIDTKENFLYSFKDGVGWCNMLSKLPTKDIAQPLKALFGHKMVFLGLCYRRDMI